MTSSRTSLLTKFVVLPTTLTFVLGLSGCTSSTNTNSSENADGNSGVNVVVSTTIWGDIVSQIVDCAEGGNVEVLIPSGIDPHDYSPSSADITKMVQADLVIANGLGLEESLSSAFESAQKDGVPVFFVAPELNPLTLAENGEGEAHEETENAQGVVEKNESAHNETVGTYDPHVWLDMERAAAGAKLLGGELAEVTNNSTFTRCGTEVAESIEKANAEVTNTLQSVPVDKRKLITDHDALNYFSEAYGYEIVGVVIPGGSTLGESSSESLANLIKVIEAEKVSTIFVNTATNTKLSGTLANEVGNVSVVPLYVDSLGEKGSQAETYQGMMRANADLISTNLLP